MRLLLGLAIAFLTFGWMPGALANEHALGFTVGGTSASGFSYRYFDKRGLGAQMSGFLFHVTGSTYAAFGTQALFTFQKAGWGRLYGLAGVGLYQGMRPIFGAGPGIELGGARGATLAIEMPLAYVQGIVLPVPNVSYLYRF